MITQQEIEILKTAMKHLSRGVQIDHDEKHHHAYMDEQGCRICVFDFERGDDAFFYHEAQRLVPKLLEAWPKLHLDEEVVTEWRESLLYEAGEAELGLGRPTEWSQTLRRVAEFLQYVPRGRSAESIDTLKAEITALKREIEIKNEYLESISRGREKGVGFCVAVADLALVGSGKGGKE